MKSGNESDESIKFRCDSTHRWGHRMVGLRRPYPSEHIVRETPPNTGAQDGIPASEVRAPQTALPELSVPIKSGTLQSAED